MAFLRISLSALKISAFLLPAAVVLAQANAADVILDVADGWRVSYDAAQSVLECRHASSGTGLKGQLAFSLIQDGKRVPWTVQLSRDPFSRRLALIDQGNNVQGYVAVAGDRKQLSLKAVHRPRNTYAGELRFTPEIHFGRRAFACRTRLDADPTVVQMASGPADSLLNDSLFDAEKDRLLRFGGQKAIIATRDPSADGAVGFRADLIAEITKPNASAITIDLLPDYYRSRWAPNYQLIDRKRCPKAPTGWMAWNVYFDAATEDDDLAEARVAAKHLRPYGLEFWSIESWQDNSPHLPVSDFHNLTLRASPQKFPHGMKWMAEQIRALGFRPGIWTVPFGTGDKKFYQQHRDWFLHDAQGRPMSNWAGRYVLDPSQAAVRKFMEETHRTMSADWGYEFFKIDGMSGSGPHYSAHFFERPEVRAAFREACEYPYAKCVEALRRGIGPDRVFLACQSQYTGPEIGLCDAARTGGDLVTFPNPPSWVNYVHQAHAAQSQLFVNNILWYSDPDTLMVGDAFAPLDSARVATTVVALPGQLTFFGDKLGKLSPDRMRLLQQTLPVCDVRPLDLAPLDELKPVWDLKIRRPFGSWDVVSAFNWGDRPTTLRLGMAQLGLDATKDYLVFDFWNRKFLGSRQGNIELQLKPHSNALLAIHQRLDRPQFLSTDRHVSQGGVELLDMAWNEASGELVCTFDLVANDRSTAYFHVPAPYVFEKAEAEDADIESAVADTVLSVKLHRNTSGHGKLYLTFRKK
jgi:hypothetical protein